MQSEGRERKKKKSSVFHRKNVSSIQDQAESVTLKGGEKKKSQKEHHGKKEKSPILLH